MIQLPIYPLPKSNSCQDFAIFISHISTHTNTHIEIYVSHIKISYISKRHKIHIQIKINYTYDKFPAELFQNTLQTSYKQQGESKQCLQYFA